ncbi:MAG: tetratricopeptide repeat protein [Geminicoccaceae bacterium]
MRGNVQRQSAATLSADDVRAQLARLLESAGFAASPRRRRLLAYIVEQTLAGHGGRLKAFDLAIAVLGRDERFDAQNDPIVRIEVGRLRRDLDHYYESTGQGDAIRITIPKGRYVPAFTAMPLGVPPSEPVTGLAARGFGWRSLARRPIGIGLCLGVLALTGALWRWAPWRDLPEPQRSGPAVVVQPLQVLGNTDGGKFLATGLTSGLVSDLMRFDGLQVFTGVDSKGTVPAAAGVPAYLVAGEVERGASRIRVTARLTDRGSGQVLWSETYERALTTAEIFDVERELTAAIIGQLAQVYGVINTEAMKQLGQGRPATLFAYDCVQQAFAYRRTFAKELYPGVRSCLEEAVRRDPDYAAAWAMLAFAHLDAARYGLVEPALRPVELRAGLDAAQHAVDLGPGSVVALQSLAALRYGSGDFDEAERLQRQAIALNPNNPESLAQLGWRLVVRGRPDEGRALLESAIARSLVVPSWYHETLAAALYLVGEFARARDEAELGKEDCCGTAYAVLAITEAAVGNVAAARSALDEALRQAPVLATDPSSLWADFQVAPDVIERLNAGLAKAGL